MAALADGMVVPTIAYPAKITIPDQRALICYSNGTERLVIETRFTGAGTNFAWVVPLPGQPVIEEATTGLFPTLQYLFRPEIVHEVPRYWWGILLTCGLIYLFLLLAKYKSIGCAVFAFILLMYLAALLLPALSSARRGGMESTTPGQNVSILDRKLVGVFETTTIASHDAKALQVWLSENGFTVPTNAEPVIASYVKDGWVFVATKVRRDQPDIETSTPHPLSFTFKTDKPVYPMRLTGVDSGPLSIELYVFGPTRAKAAHFNVERCILPNYPVVRTNPARDIAHEMVYWRRWSPETPEIVHPLLRQWVDGSPVATKLVATLSQAQMRQDVWLDWNFYWEKKNHLFSKVGALTIALNWGSGLFAAGLLVVCASIYSPNPRKPRLPRLVGTVIAASLGLIGLIFLCLPKIEVRLERGFPGRTSENVLLDLSDWLEDTNAVGPAQIRAEAKRLLSNPTNDVQWVRYASVSLKAANNDLLGGHIHEEDSPGNYSLRETSDGQLEFVTYDAEGGEHVFGNWPLASPR